MDRLLRTTSIVLASGGLSRCWRLLPRPTGTTGRRIRGDRLGRSRRGLRRERPRRGPVNYGIERYALKDAAAGTYQVALQVYGDPACTVPALPPFLTARMTTNGAGNAHGGAVFPTADVAAIVLEPSTVWGIWSFTSAHGTTYSTDCEQIVLDVP